MNTQRITRWLVASLTVVLLAGEGPTMAATGANPSDIRLMQSCLAILGYYDGPLDGVLGGQTLRAGLRYTAERGIAHHDTQRWSTMLAGECIGAYRAQQPPLYRR